MAKVTGVRALPLRGSTPDGGWQDEENEDVTPDDLHCLIEITTVGTVLASNSNIKEDRE